jgi:hypothetical protein
MTFAFEAGAYIFLAPALFSLRRGYFVPVSSPRSPVNECPAYVGLWHKADILSALTNVRFEGNNGQTNRCLPISIYEYTA